MKVFYYKSTSDDLSKPKILAIQSIAKKQDCEQVAFWWLHKELPYLVIGTNEDLSISNLYGQTREFLSKSKSGGKSK